MAASLSRRICCYNRAMPQRDKVKARANWKRWYAKHKATHIARVRVVDARRRKALRAWLTSYKTTVRCAKCGFDNSAALDFHHPRKDKEFSIGDSVRAGWSIARVQREIAKCVVLCANCHRILHA